ncbi:MAG: hypothetical protein JJ895_03820 [Balneolaceae bacterium]|nr:hypothetical protein [Balneolaceae bacterium]
MMQIEAGLGKRGLLIMINTNRTLSTPMKSNEKQMHRLREIGALVLLLLVPISFAHAQQTEKDSVNLDIGWGTFGLGIDSPLDLGYGFSANIGRNHFWQLGFQNSSELSFGGSGAQVNMFHVGKGYSLVNRVGRIALAAGPAFVWGTDHFDSNTGTYDNFTALGLTLNGQAFVTPIKEIGIGVEVFYNINNTINVAGFRIIFGLEGFK